MQYSLDIGETWINIGEISNINNFYNDNLTSSALDYSGGNGNAWTGSSNEYLLIGQFLSELEGEQVIFRLVFGADTDTEAEGIAFDNVQIVDRSSIPNFASCDTVFADNDPGLATAMVTVPVPSLNNATGSEI